MSFQAPVFLAGLAAIPLVLLALAAARRRPGRYVVRFPALATLQAVVPRAPRWRKVVPTALLCLALAGLITALARPEATVAVPVERASVMLVTDTSGSMNATDVAPNRLAAAKSSAQRFLGRVPKSLQVGLVAYADGPHTVLRPTQDRVQVKATLASLQAQGGTATGDALAAALEGIARDRKNGKRPPAAIVLLSDGKTTTGRDPLQVARQAGRAKVPIFTVALGTPGATIPNPYPYASPLPVPPDPATLKAIAAESKGRAYTVEDAGELQSIYQRLGSSIGTKKRQQEVTAVFAIGGLLLLAGAAAASLRWSGRLP